MLQTSSLRIALVSAALTFMAAGCQQQEGEVCEIESECAEGLTCCFGGTARGLCVADGTCRGATGDAGLRDGGSEDGGSEDAAVDAGDEDAGPDEDAGLEDAGPADSGVETDAGTDAGPADAGPDDAGITLPDAGL